MASKSDYKGRICTKHPEAEGLRRARGQCVECHKAACRLGARRRHELLKAEIIAHYGGVCAKCGEADLDVLTVDHPNQDGSDHRKGIGMGRNSGSNKFYRWLKSNKFPPVFRILCLNCNMKAWRDHLRSITK